MNFDIEKDVDPIDVIGKIRTIFKKNDIDVNVEYLNIEQSHFSTKAEITNTNIYSLATGINEEESLAKAYASFIGKLQAQALIDFKDIVKYKKTDEKICNIRDFKNKNVIEDLKRYDLTIEKLQKLHEWFSINKTKKDKIKLESYVSFKKRKIEFLPAAISFLQSEIGIAFENTYEEACVCALSDIIEKHCAKEIFLNNTKLPKIPKEVYEKSYKLTSLIQKIEELGYKITIKDASLGLGFPTICAIFEDIKYPKNGISISFGTHPYLDFALENCLLKFLQTDEAQTERKDLKFKQQTNDSKLEKIIKELCNNIIYFKKTNVHIQNFLSDEFDYEFNKNIWLFEKNFDDKTLFLNLANQILKYSDDIYIRNCSFLGFPTIKVYAPNFSIPYLEEKNLYETYCDIYFWMDYAKRNITGEEKEMVNLLKTCKYICEFCSQKDEDKLQIGNTKARYFIFYCSLVINNRKNIKNYSKAMISNTYTKLKEKNEKINNPMLRLFQGFCKYFQLKRKKIDEEKIKKIIEKQYSPMIYQEIIKTLNTINDEMVKISIRAGADGSIQKDTIIKNELKTKLFNLYKKNKPNQKIIFNIIRKMV